MWEDWVETLHPDNRGEIVGIFDRVAAGETVQGSFRVDAPDGSPRWFHATAFPIVDAEGCVRRIGGLLVEAPRTKEARVYLVAPGDELTLPQALAADGCRVRRFDALAGLLDVIDDLLPGAVVIGSQEPLTNILNASMALKQNARRLPWIVVGSLNNDLNAVVQLMKSGAANILADDAPPEAIRSAVLTALPNPDDPSPSAPAPAPGPSDARQKIAQLSTRERQVLEGLAAGGTNKTIALNLALSPRTVETYRAQLMDRLGVRTLAELIRLVSEASPSA
ncbi:MAG: LuxR C-terminal-related transcriptional regulator [Pseudomonadota bacterium]